MITGAIKNKVDKIWTDIWAGGITNPITVIEQLTYLMFIRSLDEKELENSIKLVLPSPHLYISQKIREIDNDIYFDGEIMGGGKLKKTNYFVCCA